jgi:hypothetical protein
MDRDYLQSLTVRVGGRDIPDGWDRLARYCGLPWSGGADETWAFRYYDSVPSRDPNRISATDVAAAAALHPGLTHRDLRSFHDQRPWLNRWLADLPDDIALTAADPDIAHHVAAISTWDTPIDIALLTKVLHRKKPKLIPIYDRAIADWYTPITGSGEGPRRWRSILATLRDDDEFTNQVVLSALAAGVSDEAFVRISTLRVADILVWMQHRHAAV